MSAISLFVASLLSLNAIDDSCHRNCVTSESGVQLISHFEGFSPYMYKDSAGLDTIGYGHLIRRGESFNEPMLPEEAHRLLQKDLKDAESVVNRHVAVTLRQHQADAVISFTFNVGPGKKGVKDGLVALKASGRPSTLLRRINEERHEDVPDQFRKWVRAAGVVVRGLVRRREAEATLYSGG